MVVMCCVIGLPTVNTQEMSQSDLLSLVTLTKQKRKKREKERTLIMQKKKKKGIVSESLRKIRTTARFLLGNLHDFNRENYVDYDNLQEVDQYMLHELYQYNDRVSHAYSDFAFNRGK